MAKKNQKLIEKDTVLYRARLFTGDDSYHRYINSNFKNEGLDKTGQLLNEFYRHNINSRKESEFWGYNENDSFIPPNNDLINDGRANPAYIRYLYTSEQPYTAMTEVRPFLESKVSVATIKVLDSLNIVDFSEDAFINIHNEFDLYLIYFIMNDFSKPNNSDKKSYLPTQYIAEFIKTLGFEGIRFDSSLHGTGKNITIFNYDKCKPTSSKLYEIKDICFEADSIAPVKGDYLIHEKLKQYKLTNNG